MLDPCGVVRRCGQGDDGEEEWAQLVGGMSLSHGSEITGQRAKPQGEERLKKHVGARSKVAVLRCAARLAYNFRALTANGFWANLHQVLASYIVAGAPCTSNGGGDSFPCLNFHSFSKLSELATLGGSYQ